MYSNVILRWCLGIQDTTRLGDFTSEGGIKDIIWLAKLSIASFQKWFPGARFILFYNGDDLDTFVDYFYRLELELFADVEFVNQLDGVVNSPYHFMPQGVWWKWVPFRYDKSCHEISIDTDIVCISKPVDWYKWLDGDKEIILAPERFSRILVNTCGDFHLHPVLKNHKPLNCGVVGHRAGFDFSERFFEITREIDYGYTHNSLFITEQGAINVWAYSLAMIGVEPYVLDFEKCSWIRDFIYYLEKGVKVETIHATTWHKKIAKALRPILERRIFKDDYDDLSFLGDIISAAQKMDYYSKYVFRRQLGDDRKEVEYFF